MKSIKGKKGISLITLIVTIVVALIIIAALVLTLKNNGTIRNANETRFKSDISTFRDELTIWLSKEYGDTTGKLKTETVNATKDSGTYKNLKMQEIINSMNNDYAKKLIIEEAELKFIGDDHDEIRWFDELMNPGPLKALKGIKQISSGAMHNMALMNDGTVRAWGGPPEVLGMGFIDYPQPWPQKVLYGEPDLMDIVNLNVPGVWTSPIYSDHIVIDFHSDSSGTREGFIIGKIRYRKDGKMIEEKLTQPIAHINYDNYEDKTFEIYREGAESISVNFCLFITENYYDYVEIWDYDGNDSNHYTGYVYADSLYMLESKPLSGVAKISAGLVSNFAIMRNGSVKTWGINVQDMDQNEYGMPIDYYPKAVFGISNVKQIVSNTGMCLALMNDGTVRYWGMSVIDHTIIRSPRQIYGLKGVKKIGAGAFNFVFLMEDGTVRESGTDLIEIFNAMREERDVINFISYNTSVPVAGLTNVKDISIGFLSNLALMNDGTVKTWGYNMDFVLKAKHTIKAVCDIIREAERSYYYEPSQEELNQIISDLENLGVDVEGTDMDDILFAIYSQFVKVPITIENIENVIDIATGVTHFATIYEDSTMQVHGLATGYYIARMFPFFDFQPGPVMSAAQEKHYELKSMLNLIAGKLDVYKLNTNNNLEFKNIYNSGYEGGDYSMPKVNIFRDDVTLGNVRSISASFDGVLALLQDGTLWSWGENYIGQIGEGSFNQSDYPIEIDPSVDHEMYGDYYPGYES